MPSDQDARDAMIRAFLAKHDELQARVDRLTELTEGLLELGHMIVLALGDAARAQQGNPVGNFLGTVAKAAQSWNDIVAALRRRR